MPYLISAGKITKGPKVPMHILARLNVNGQAISVAKFYKELGVGLDSRKAGQCPLAGGRPAAIPLCDLPRRHPRYVAALLAGGGRH